MGKKKWSKPDRSAEMRYSDVFQAGTFFVFLIFEACRRNAGYFFELIGKTCDATNAIVVAVEYRKAPEHKFPTAVNDAFTAYKWVLKNADSLRAFARIQRRLHQYGYLP